MKRKGSTCATADEQRRLRATRRLDLLLQDFPNLVGVSFNNRGVAWKSTHRLNERVFPRSVFLHFFPREGLVAALGVEQKVFPAHVVERLRGKSCFAPNRGKTSTCVDPVSSWAHEGTGRTFT